MNNPIRTPPLLHLQSPLAPFPRPIHASLPIPHNTLRSQIKRPTPRTPNRTNRFLTHSPPTRATPGIINHSQQTTLRTPDLHTLQRRGYRSPARRKESRWSEILRRLLLRRPHHGWRRKRTCVAWLMRESTYMRWCWMADAQRCGSQRRQEGVVGWALAD